MKHFELRFRDYVDGSICTHVLEADGETAQGLLLYRDSYAADAARVIRPEDEKPLLAAFCAGHDAITDHIIARCFADGDYCRSLSDLAFREFSRQQNMDWTAFGVAKFASFQAARTEGKLEQLQGEFTAYVQFMIRANRPVPSLFQDLISLREL